MTGAPIAAYAWRLVKPGDVRKRTWLIVVCGERVAKFTEAMKSREWVVSFDFAHCYDTADEALRVAAKLTNAKRSPLLVLEGDLMSFPVNRLGAYTDEWTAQLINAWHDKFGPSLSSAR